MFASAELRWVKVRDVSTFNHGGVIWAEAAVQGGADLSSGSGNIRFRATLKPARQEAP